VTFAEKVAIFKLGEYTENRRYYPEISINIDYVFTVRLPDDGSEIVPQKLCLIRKFVADF
jgi:hypothetical protein